MRKLKLFSVVLFATLLLSGCVFQKKEAIITVNSVPITQADYDDSYKALTKNENFAQLEPEMKNNPDSYINLMLKDKIVNELIIKALLKQEMDKKNIVVTDQDINDEIINITDKVGSKEKFTELLKQNDLTLSQFKKEVAEDLKLHKLIDTLSLIKVSDKEVEKFYKDNIDNFKYPDKVRASHILIMADERSIKDAIKASGKKLTDEQIDTKVNEEMSKKLAKAQSILAQLKQDPTKFAQLAKENSEDTVSAKQGGDLGFFTYDQMVKPFSDAAFSQKPNVIGELVKTDYGYHIIMVTDRQQAGVEPFNKVSAEIKMYMENQKKVEVLQGLVESLKNKAEIVYVNDDYNLQKIQDKLKSLVEQNPALGIQPQSAKE